MPNPQRIIDMASAFYDSCVLFTASDLGVFATLARHPGADAAQVAGELELDARGTRLLLDACAALGLLAKKGEGYSNTAESATFLVPGSPADLSGAIRYNRDVYPAWGRLPELVRGGEPAEAPEIHLGADPRRTRSFVLSMHGRALAIGRAVVPCLQLHGRRRLLDVGGGPGTYSVLIAKRFPEISCQVLDLPEVAKIAEELVAEQGMQERVSTVGGDYHSAPFGEGYDAIIFFGMLHQERPEAIADLFARAYDALEPGGVVHVMDMMTDATHTAPRFSALFAVNMALTTRSGWVFSDAELEGWLRAAGFDEFSVSPLPPPMPHWLATAMKPA